MSSRDKMFNRIAMVITIILAIVALWVVTASAATLECPAGTYDAGGFCKNEPTGCPYGDSVPLEKCEAPKEQSPVNRPEPTEEEVVVSPQTTEEIWGK